MNGFQIAQIIVINVHTDAEVETRIASIYNFEIPKLYSWSEGTLVNKWLYYCPYWLKHYLYKVGVLSISHGDHCVHFLN